ncbi:hypothetical protein R1flu_019238 [Riccia fluitans]|uniref:Myb-like domain-containing protein n=1 Tax=Riccia fluitans TaxID=41844 RepID=A0ABD1ZJL2_9MARC
MEERGSEGGGANEGTLIDCSGTTISVVGAGGGGTVEECVDSVLDEPQRKKRRHSDERDFPAGFKNSVEYDGPLRNGTVSIIGGEVDHRQQQQQQPNISSATAIDYTPEVQHEICALPFEIGGGEIAGNGGSAESKELRIQIPGTRIHFSEATPDENGTEEEEDDGERELIPKFDPEENGNSLFTDELRAAVEEGSEHQLPPVMCMENGPHFSSDGPQLLVTSYDETKEIANGGLRSLSRSPSANGAHEMDTGNLDVIDFKLYAALQQQVLQGSSYLPAVNETQTAQGHDQYRQQQQSLDQEHSEDKNPVGLDEGERTPRHPRWTKEETAVLVAGKRKCDEEFRTPQSGSKFTSATERWDFISDYCKVYGVDRDAHQCRKRWSNLAADFKKIRNWHKQSEVEPYWSLRGDSRRKNKLPGSFDPEIYADMEAATDSNNAFKKRKVVPPVIAENGGEHEYDPLASVLETSGRAMQAALAKNIQAQIEAHNQNSELDRVQRKEHSDSLVGVLGLLADSLARIAEKL